MRKTLLSPWFHFALARQAHEHIFPARSSRIPPWALATIALIGAASPARADTIDIPLTSTTYIDSYYTTQNLGGGTSVKNVMNGMGHDGGSVTRSLLALPAIVVPAQDAGDEITSVTLNLYCSTYSPPTGGTTTFSMVAYPMTQSFVQGSCTSSNQTLTPGATWLTYDGTHPWATPGGGGDFDSSVSVTANATPVTGSWTTFDLTNIWTDPSLVLQQQEMQNYGVELTVSPENPNLVLPSNSYVTESFRNDNAYPPPTPVVPYLAVTFTPVPEPSALALLAAGAALAAIGFGRRCRTGRHRPMAAEPAE